MFHTNVSGFYLRLLYGCCSKSSLSDRGKMVVVNGCASPNGDTHCKFPLLFLTSALSARCISEALGLLMPSVA